MGDFLALFDSLYNSLKNGDANATVDERPCISKIDHQLLHLYLLIPSTITTVAMAFMMKRTNRWLGFLQGRPGVVYPMSLLGRTNRFSYAAAWGAIAYLVSDVIFHRKYAADFPAPVYAKVFLALLSMLIYGIDYFPLFASLTHYSLMGCAIGTAYAWTFFSIQLFKLTECDFHFVSRVILFFRDLPLNLCWLYLSLSLPFRLFLLVRHRRSLLSSTETNYVLKLKKDVSMSVEGIRCVELFKPEPPPPPPPTSQSDKIRAALKQAVGQILYHRHRNFRYSARILSVMLIGVLLLYKATFELAVEILPLIQVARLYLKSYIEEEVGWSPVPGEAGDTAFTRSVLLFAYDISTSIRACFLTSLTLAGIIGIVMILHMLTSYRTNLLALNKGDNSHIPPRTINANATLLVGSLKYAGFQVGYIAWGFMLQFITLLLVTTALAFVITLLKLGISGWIVTLITNTWPVLLVSVLCNVVQTLVAKFAFLQRSGDVLALNNRRGLFCFSFFLFFYNIFLGFFSCLLRILKAVVIGTLFMSRLDNSTLPRRFQMMDPGFSAYVGFIHVENAHTHPVLLVFLRLLLLLKNEKGVPSSHEKKTIFPLEQVKPNGVPQSKRNIDTKPRTSGRARTRWFLLYTLYQNPQLRTSRKAHIRFMKQLQERLAKRYAMSHSAIQALMKNVKTVVSQQGMSDSEVDLETDPVTGIPNNWAALMTMNKFMMNLKREEVRRRFGTNVMASSEDEPGQVGVNMKDVSDGPSEQPLKKWNLVRAAVNPQGPNDDTKVENDSSEQNTSIYV